MVFPDYKGSDITKMYTLYKRLRDGKEEYLSHVSLTGDLKLTHDITKARPFVTAREAYDYARDKEDLLGTGLLDFRVGARACAGMLRKPQRTGVEMGEEA